MENGRVSGMILGAVAGDCLGTPYVFMRSEKLFERSSQIVWEISESGICSRLLECGLASVARHGVNYDMLVRAYNRWSAKGQELDCVMALCFDGRKKSAMHLRDFAATLDHGALCSDLLLIRQIPVVLAGLGWDRETLFRQVAAECRLTHDDDVSIEYAQLYAYCLQCILNGKSRTEIWDCLFDAVESPDVRMTLLNSYYGRPRCDDPSYSHAKIAFWVSMYHFWHDTPMVPCFRSVVLSGGATDVNAAAAGALCGAWHGIEALPRAWRDTLLDEAFGAGVLIQKALRMSTRITRSGALVLSRPMRHPRLTDRRGAQPRKAVSSDAEIVS